MFEKCVLVVARPELDSMLVSFACSRVIIVDSITTFSIIPVNDTSVCYF